MGSGNGIAVRIPDEIRKYKEKLFLGMTARQIVCVVLALGICIPLWWFGRSYMDNDVLSVVMFFIALPLIAVGFINVNNMPFEKYAAVFLTQEVLLPRNRKYHSRNAWRDWAEEADKTEEAERGKRAMETYRKDAANERTFLLAEAEENRKDLDEAEKKKLLTVKYPDKKKKENQTKKKNNKKTKKKTKTRLEAEDIERRQKADPHYVPTQKDMKKLRALQAERLEERKQDIQNGEKEIKGAGAKKAKRRKAKTTIPKSTQDSIPYIADYEEGMFEVSPNKYSKMYRLKDINYRTGREEDQEFIFCKLGEFFNYFSDDEKFSVTIDNRVVSREEQERKVFKKLRGDAYDKHRKEYNRVLRGQIVAGKNNMEVQKFITVTIDANDPVSALIRFHKIDAEVITNLRKIGSDGEVLSTEERLAYYHDKYRMGSEGDFNIDFDFLKEQGISSKDYIAPTWMQFNRKNFRIDDEWYQILFLNNLPAAMQDDFLENLCDNDFPVIATLNIEPVAQDKALQIVRRQMTGIESDKIEAEKNALKSGYSPDTIRHDIKDSLAQAEELYDDMMNKNQKMFLVSITLMVHGSTEEELEENSKVLMGKARSAATQLQVLREQQEEGYKITVPFGYHSKSLSIDRTLTTESTAVFMPFSNQEIFQPGGFYYGTNQISHNLVVVDRTKMKTPSGFILGSAGSGKSFAAKKEILNVLLDGGDSDVLIVDPENEYGDFCRAFGGSVLKISSTSDNYINPLDMSPDYGLDEDDDSEFVPLSIKKEKALKKKSDYIMSIVERMISVGGSGDETTITPQQKTLVDECLQATYKEYLDSDFDQTKIPTLIDFQNELDKRKGESPEARQVAEGVAYYTRGSMDLFAHKTNVNIDNRLVVFNVRDLGGQLQQIGFTIVFDYIWNRMVSNKFTGKRTYVYCDEIHTMFRSYYSADYLNQLYKRGRKYGLVITGITQDVTDLLQSEKAKTMLSNSDFILMLNQSLENMKVLSAMLNISETQIGFVTASDAGSGLIFAEKVIVPFIDRFPTNSYLYRLMSTKFGEEMSKEEVDREIADIMKDAERKEIPEKKKEA